MRESMGKASTAVRVLLLLAVPLSMGLGCGQPGGSGCIVLGGGNGVKGSSSTPQTFNLGFEAWKMMRGVAAADDHCGTAKVAVWDKHKDAFIAAVNTAVPAEELGTLPLGVKSLFPLIDDGTIPAMTDDLAGILERLYKDPQDPDQQALKAFVRLTQAQNRVVEVDDLVGFLGRALRAPEVEEVIKAVSQVTRENDGVDDQGQPNGERDLITDTLKLVSTRLGEFELPNVNEPSNLSLISELLKPASLPSSVDFGAPAWAVRVDRNGNPKVAVDPATGTLYKPFDDVDRDGAADVNGQGQPVDSMGEPIRIPAFSTEGARDAARRALAPDGATLYEYYDAKRTGLAMMLTLLGESMKKGAGQDLRPLAAAALGPRVMSDNGTPGDPSDDYERFAWAGNAALDFQWGGWEIMRYDQVPLLLRVLGRLARENPALGERILVDIGKIWKAIDSAGLLQNAQDINGILDIVEGLSSVLDGIFEQSNTGGQSTARMLVRIYSDMGAAAQALPGQMAVTIRYRTLVRTNGAVNPQLSIPVDYTQPMVYNGIDNRSAFEQGIFLLDAVNGPALPLIGKSIAQLVIETLAGLNTTTIQGLLTLVLGAARIPLVDWMAIGTLNLLGYDGRQVWNDLNALDALAKSGALDGYLPLARAFVQRRQVPLILSIYRELVADLRKDLDSDPAAYSIIRRAEPAMMAVLDGPAAGNFHSLITTMLRVPGENGSTAADHFVDAIAHVVDDDAAVYRRDGTLAPGRMRTLTEPVRSLINRMNAAGDYPKFNHLLTTLIDAISETALNDNGTPGNPADDFQQLKRPGVVPVVAAFAGYAEQLLNVPPSQRADYISEQQVSFQEFVLGRSFSQMMRFWDAVDASPGGPAVYAGLHKLLIPATASVSQDVFGALMRVLAQLLQKGGDPQLMGDLFRYLGRTVDPANAYVLNFMRGTARIVEQEFSLSGLDVLRNSLWQGEDGLGTAPVTTFLAVMDDLRRIDEETCLVQPAAPDLTVAEVEDLLKSVVEFVRDDVEGGLPRIYAIIRNRKK